ncbi:MAG: hypothetical protein AAB225_10840, partial [Acidobacteriota bacterium]
SGIGLLVIGKDSLYGQVGPQRVPDLRGLWTGSIYGCMFLDALARTNNPIYGGDDDIDIEITLQQGRSFAGRGGDPEDKVTGILLPDGTVQIQFFDPDHTNRGLATGTLSIEKGRYVMRVYSHGFDDLNRADRPPMMYTAEIVLQKQ